MTGRELYDRYNFEMAEQGVEIDEWDELPENDQQGWNKTAKWAERQVRSSLAGPLVDPVRSHGSERVEDRHQGLSDPLG